MVGVKVTANKTEKFDLGDTGGEIDTLFQRDSVRKDAALLKFQ